MGEVVREDQTSSTPVINPVRWQARELIYPEDGRINLALVTPKTDVWSFGMLSLEIMTGRRPFYYKARDAMVIEELLARRLPKRPVDDVVVERGLGEELWAFMLRCWTWDPSGRPSMASVKQSLKAIPLPSTLCKFSSLAMERN